MDSVWEFMKGTSIQTLIGTFLMLVWFVRHIDNTLDAQSKRTDRLYEMFIDLLREEKSKKRAK